MDLSRLLLYFNTVRYLKPKQISYNIVRRFSKYKKATRAFNTKNRVLSLVSPIQCQDKLNEDFVCFLNKQKSIDDIKNWSCPEETKLWRYNLHYFDYLLDPGASNDLKDKLINDWIVAGQGLKEDAWEPYPVSLRIVNWIKYFICYKNSQIPDHWLDSLYQQAHALFNSIEYHILANHYLKNGKALCYAGAYLNTADSRKWFKKGKQIVLEEAEEQIFDDGGHYEKSPMYHSIIVEDYLDIINLIQSNSLDITAQETSYLKEKTTCSLGFLNKILMPDGNIPLFNDSAFRIAPHPDVIFEYANQVMGYEKIHESNAQSITSFGDSGYYIIRDGDNMCVIDCGSVSPGYQPGHTHCDFLSYELVINGRRVIVDSGVHDYEDSELRRYVRSTRAHNTVMVDDTEQSEIWGTFRVARRAKSLGASIFRKDDSTVVFEGGHDGYKRLHGNVVHHRKLTYSDGKNWKVEDSITGEGLHKSTSYVHIHPDFEIRREGSIVYINSKSDEMIARIVVGSGVDSINIGKSWYCPEFGRKFENTVIEIVKEGKLPHSLSYEIFKP